MVNKESGLDPATIPISSLSRNIANAFGRRLTDLAVARQLTRSDIALRSGLAIGTVCALFKGESDPRLSTMLALQRALGLGSIEELLGPARSRQLWDELSSELTSTNAGRPAT